MVKKARITLERISGKEFFNMVRSSYAAAVDRRITNIDNPHTLPKDKEILFTAVRSIKPKVTLEIGTHKGYTTLGLALNNPAGKFYTVDISRDMKELIPGDKRQGREVLLRG